MGLQGTGSKDLVAHDLFVPEGHSANTLALFGGRSPHATVHATNLYRISAQEMLSLSVTAAVLGSALHACDAFVEHTRERKNVLTGARKADHVPTQLRAAEAAMEVHAAELLVAEMHDEFDRQMTAGERADAAHRSKWCWQAAFAADLCRRAVNRLYEASGAHAVYDGGAVQTAFRNVNVGAQHASIGFDTGAEAYGKSLFEERPGADR
jgi:3-hydroxy-9,10-secoandrosta-1,3,5(10)-triene-9,17-dione monooxygenase